MKARVVKVNDDSLLFDNGVELFSDHSQDCCEWHYLSFADLDMGDFMGLEFDLESDGLFERIPDYGIALKPLVGFPVRVPGYGSNNGYYSSDLVLVITDRKNFSKRFDISECQDY